MTHTFATASDYKRTQFMADYVVDTWHAFQDGQKNAFDALVDHVCNDVGPGECAACQTLDDHVRGDIQSDQEFERDEV